MVNAKGIGEDKVYPKLTKAVAKRISDRLSINLHAHPNIQSYSFIYNGLDCELQIARVGGKHLFYLQANPPEAYREIFRDYVESDFKDNRALKEAPEFERARKKGKISELERKLPLKEYHVNRVGLKATYEISDEFNLMTDAGKKDFAAVIFDALRCLLLFYKKVK